MIDLHTELQMIVTKKDKYTEWQMLRRLKEFQDALDEVPNADPYEKLRIFKNQFGDIVAMANDGNIEWPCAIICNEEV